MRILEKQKSKILCRMSFFTSLTAGYGFIRGHHLAICPTTIFLTSILYWSDPVQYSFRQYLDIGAVSSSTLYSFYMAKDYDHAFYFYTLSGIAILWYPIGYYYHFRGNQKGSLLSHIVLHFFANLANIVLYSGGHSGRQGMQGMQGMQGEQSKN